MIRTRIAPEAAPAASPESIVSRMARKMREMGMNGVAVTADSLAEHSNFTRAEIAAYGRQAADEAKAASVRQLHEAH